MPTEVVTPTDRAEAAYNRAVENGIKNVMLFGALLTAAVWLSPWTWLSRFVWVAVALTTFADCLSLLGKFSTFRALQTGETERITRALHVGMLVVVISENIVLIGLLVWTGFHVW